MISKYGRVEVVVVSTYNPREKAMPSHGYNNWKYFYPSAGESFKIQDILDAIEVARSEGKLPVNADGNVDGRGGTHHILWDLMKGFTKLKNPTDVELFKDNPDTYKGIKKHQGRQKHYNTIVPNHPSVSKPRFKYHDFPLNQIFYGPPGTGKTYETKSLAVEIITGDKLSSRGELNSRYNSLVKDDRIQFITFHQSYGYEDFVEGIKPKLDKPEGGDVQYRIKDGIFKKMCKKASDEDDTTAAVLSNVTNTQPERTLVPSEYRGRDMWQLRVGPHGYLNKMTIAIDGISWFNKYSLEDEVKNSQGDVKKFTEILKQNISEQKAKGKASYHTVREGAAKKNMIQFCLKMKEGDLIIVHERPKGSKKPNQILAVVEIIGGYKYDKDRGEYNHTRKVKYLWRKEDNELHLNGQGLSALVICGDSPIKPEELMKKVNELIGVTREARLVAANPKYSQHNYVLIIDEINRGNISKILGELITLLEEDKRLGRDEALKVTLPYSNERFGVPSNLYIIGTMNTADRSIAFLDTALRRRFNFKEMMPKSEKLEKNMEGINLQKLLKAINTNITRELDRDHQIGHSYLLKIESMEELSSVFRHKICPLLDEYFYDRRDKIKEVLNNCELIVGGNDNGNWEWADDVAFDKPVNYTKIYKDK